MRIFDCFTFFNELDLLEIRLNELDGVVDRFVIAEAELTHNGDPKPLYFHDNRERFAKFSDKIIHVIVTAADFSQAEMGNTFQERAWMRENIQRNAVSKGIKSAGAKADDIVIVSDLDEIPCASAIHKSAISLNPGDVIGFALRHYNYFLNLRCASSPIWGNDPKMAYFATFTDESVCDLAPWTIFILPTVNTGATATRFRYTKTTQRIKNAGWHFSYCGGIDVVLRKVKAFNEFGLFKRKDLISFISNKLSNLRGLYGENLLPEPLDASFPACVINNQSKFANLIVTADIHPLKRRILRRWFLVVGVLKRSIWRFAFWATPQWLRRAVKQFIEKRRNTTCRES